VKDTFFSSKLRFKSKGILHEFAEPVVMGIINVTPDSFYAGSRQNSLDEVLSIAKKMLEQGAGILDIGGYSSRPGAEEVSELEEINRTATKIKVIKNRFPEVLISIDTFRSNVAEQALLNGANIINDISGGQIDPSIFDIAAKYECPYIMMHMRGTPQNMMEQTHYNNLIETIKQFFSEQINKAEKAGVNDIIVDLGIGFSKTIDQNFELIQHLDSFKTLNKSILMGVSRKSLIYKSLGIEAAESLNGTTVLNTLCLLGGAQILRVHDVKEAREAIQLMSKFNAT